MQFTKQSVIRATPECVFQFHEQPDALAQLTPPWERARVIQPASISDIGSRAVVELVVLGFFKRKWVAEHTVYDPPNQFEDVQIEGPFKTWRHLHIVERHADGALLRDQISYEPPLGFIGRLAAPLLVQPRLEKVFNYRHEITRRWCEAKDQHLKP
ncbi:MAG TPA: SRPBCC family protein [Pyrinomonadaceae bacterium]|nr:SRPBCC family protein [Pyrinomonadaceae bacterium]